MASVWVTIPTVGTWPTQEELNSRNAIINALEANGLGICEGSGGGGGKMDFSFRVPDEKTALAAIHRVIQTNRPGLDFSVRISD